MRPRFGPHGLLLLAASRETLRMEGEQMHCLSSHQNRSASAPPKVAQAICCCAVQLLVERAAACLEGFEFRAGNPAIYAKIRAQLDGVFLEVEFGECHEDEIGIQRPAVKQLLHFQENARSARLFANPPVRLGHLIVACRDIYQADVGENHASKIRRSLSPRELSILDCIGQGRTNKETARELGIAPETVKSHIKNIFMKLAVDKRAQAISRAQSLGLVGGNNTPYRQKHRTPRGGGGLSDRSLIHLSHRNAWRMGLDAGERPR